ncbi:MAG: glutamine synthetase beta-grasp domain-containing protein [Candidatus Micrarchaeia archaeon]
MPSQENVIKFINSNNIKWIDLQFTDILGKLYRFSVSGVGITDQSFSKGVEGPSLGEVFGYDEKEIVLVPDSKTFARIPWETNSARMISDVSVALSMEKYLKDPRYVAEHMNINLKAAGITAARISTEIEFYMFDGVTIDKGVLPQSSSYSIDSREGYWNPTPFSGNKKGVYLNQPYDTYSTLRAQIAETMMESFSYPVEYHCHSKGRAGQQKIGTGTLSLSDSADAIATLKYIARNASIVANSLATFMPLPLSDSNGNGQIIGQSLWKKDRNIFYDATDKYAQISQNARYYIGGILEHASAICAFTNPTSNSYKRLKTEKYYAGWSRHAVESIVRITNTIQNNDIEKKVQFVGGDCAMNPYLAYPVVIAAGLDGIKNKTECGDPAQKRISLMTEKEKRENKIRPLPSTLLESLEALQSDEKFLKGVVPSEMISEYMELKLEEISKLENTVSPSEIDMYFNV